MVERVARHAPQFVSDHGPRARAYQLRYLARRSIQLGDPDLALTLLEAAMRSSLSPLVEEPVKSGATIAAALLARLVGPARFAAAAGRAAGGRLVA